MAEKSKLTQVSMYPKDLVYPPGGEEVQLEMIRARWKQYCPMFELTEEENGSCDMEMTEAFPVNITLNVPLITSIERGRKVLVMKEKAKETIHELSEGTELPVLNEKELDHELELLCKENSTRTMVKKKTEEDKDLEIERDLQQLMLDRENDNEEKQEASSKLMLDREKQKQEASSKDVMKEIQDKENQPPPQEEKSLFHFTPCGTEDVSHSLASWHGSSLMATKLSFSEADSISLLHDNKEGDGRRTGRGKIQATLDCEEKVHVHVHVQPRFESQFIVGYTEMESRCKIKSSELTKPDGLKNTSKYSQPSTIDSFSSYDDQIKSAQNQKKYLLFERNRNASVTGVSQSSLDSLGVYDQSHCSVSYQTKKPSLVNHKIPLPFLPPESGMNDTGTSRSGVDSFSVFEDPSISEKPPVSNQRKPLAFIPQETSRNSSALGTSRAIDSFSVFEDPSISEKPPVSNQRKPLTFIPQETSRNSSALGTSRGVDSFSVFEDPSISEKPPVSNQRKPLAFIPQETSRNSSALGTSRGVDSFSVFEDPSISEKPPVSNQRKPLAFIPQETSRNASALGTSRGVDSFSVFEDPSQSNIIPGDNTNTSKSLSVTTKTQLIEHPETQHDQISSNVVSMTIAPVVINDNSSPCDMGNQTIEPSFFTHFDIPSHHEFEPTSTPTGRRMGQVGFNPDITAIHSDTSVLFSKDAIVKHNKGEIQEEEIRKDITQPDMVVFNNPPMIRQLDTIQEESRSTYTSSSSSSLTNNNFSKVSNISSASQHSEDEGITPEYQLLRESGALDSSGHVNPFMMETINVMCNSLPITTTPIHRSPSSSPRLHSGNNVKIAGSSYTVVKKIAKGGFASIYIVANTERPMDFKKALKVQNPPFLWEVAIIEELHKRLTANDLVEMASCFMKIDSVQLYTNASIIMYDCYQYGTILDCVNVLRTANKKMHPLVLLYYTTELLRMVDALHNCGIIHADIKPDNIMMRDISHIKHHNDFIGCGLCLIDFGRSIDVRSFPNGTQFIGTSDTDSFQCVQMINNTPWTYQADLHGIAGTVHVMMHLEYMDICKHPQTGLYQPKKVITRLHNRELWTEFYQSCLNFNGSQRPDLMEIAKPLVTNLNHVMYQLPMNLKLLFTK